MTQRKKQIIAIVFAWFIATVSLAIWSHIVSLEVKEYTAESVLLDEEEIESTKEPEELLQNVAFKIIEPVQEVFIKEEEPHPAFKIDLVEDLEKVSEPELVQVSPSNKQSTAEAVLKVAKTSQIDSELSQWEIKRWLSVSIPRISVRAPVMLPSNKYWNAKQWDLLEEQMQVGLLHGATAYPHSSAPGIDGSLIIAGHSSPPHERAEESDFGHLFAKLPELEVGDVINIVGGGSIVSYKISNTKVVDANDTMILAQQSDLSLLKLITCYPVGSTRQRLIIEAVRI